MRVKAKIGEQQVDCIVEVTITGERGTFSRNAASDVDYYGWEEQEWTLLDAAGNPAPHLWDILTDEDREVIEADIEEVRRDEDDCAAADWAEQCRYNRAW